MPENKEITDLEQAYFELDKIKAQINALSDFLASKLRDDQHQNPKSNNMIDPRTGLPFRDINAK